MKKLILFDLDGTLTDSGPGIKASMRYALEKVGRTEDAERDLGFFVGPPLVPGLMEFTGCSEEEAEEIIVHFRERYEAGGGIFENSVYPGIPGLLRDLKREGCLLGVASSKPEPLVIRVLQHFDLYRYFDFLVGADPSEKGGDKAEIIEQILAESGYNWKRGDALMAGDRKYDVYGAGKCGITCIGAAYGYGGRRELEEAGADRVADSVPELDEILLALVREGAADAAPPVCAVASRSMSRGEKLWDLLFPMLYALIGTLVAGLIGGAFAASIYMTNPEINYARLVSQVTLTAIAAFNLFTIFFLPRIKRRDDLRFADPLREGWEWPSIVISIVMMVLLSHVLNTVIDISRLEHVFPGYSQSAAGVFENASRPLLIIGAVILAPIAEELIFRGLLFRRAREHLGIGWAVGLSSVVFGIFHGNIIQFIYGTALGIFLALIYDRSNTLAAPILAHLFCNLFSLYGSSFLRTIFRGSAQAMRIYFYAEIVVVILCACFLFLRKKNPVRG